MVTLAASAYFLTCCRPVLKSSFCYYVENPKLVNLYYYPYEPIFKNQYLGCQNHEQLEDHCLKGFNPCTDERSWSLDRTQERRHFLDIICGRIPLCGNGDYSGERKIHVQPNLHKENIPEDNKVKPGRVPEPGEVPSKEEDEKKVVEQDISKGSSDTVFYSAKECLESEEPPSTTVEKEKITNEDAVLLTDEIIDKLDQNLVNLESTFEKFIRKNRDFIQNLVSCLSFEKQKQKALEHDYNKLKQENCILKTNNEYLKMVNEKQLGLFKKELDKGISENKAVYKKRIEMMELQLKSDQSELQYYKQSEKKYFEFVQNENNEVLKLKNDLKTLQNKEAVILKNYVKVLNFLQDVKETLSFKDLPQLQRSSYTVSDSNTNGQLREVLKIALLKGIKNLNVRDLSILHDAIQELNDRLCHQNDYCGKNMMNNMSVSHLSMIYTKQYAPGTNIFPQGVQENESCLSIYPTRQKADPHNYPSYN